MVSSGPVRGAGGVLAGRVERRDRSASRAERKARPTSSRGSLPSSGGAERTDVGARTAALASPVTSFWMAAVVGAVALASAEVSSTVTASASSSASSSACRIANGSMCDGGTSVRDALVGRPTGSATLLPSGGTGCTTDGVVETADRRDVSRGSQRRRARPQAAAVCRRPTSPRMCRMRADSSSPTISDGNSASTSSSACSASVRSREPSFGRSWQTAAWSIPPA